METNSSSPFWVVCLYHNITNPNYSDNKINYRVHNDDIIHSKLIIHSSVTTDILFLPYKNIEVWGINIRINNRTIQQ